MVVYEADQLHSDKVVCIDETNPYFQMVRSSWGEKLREVFDGIEDPIWDSIATAPHPLMQASSRLQALKKINTPKDKLI